MKNLRKKIQDQNNLDISELAEIMKISTSSIFRVEDEKKFKNSIYIKYLIALRKYDIDINKLIDQVILTETKGDQK